MNAALPTGELAGPDFVQVEDSRHCSSAWGENCCDMPSWHDGLRWDEANGNRWTAGRANQRPTHGDVLGVKG